MIMPGTIVGVTQMDPVHLMIKLSEVRLQLEKEKAAHAEARKRFQRDLKELVMADRCQLVALLGDEKFKVQELINECNEQQAMIASLENALKSKQIDNDKDRRIRELEAEVENLKDKGSPFNLEAFRDLKAQNRKMKKEVDELKKEKQVESPSVVGFIDYQGPPPGFSPLIIQNQIYHEQPEPQAHYPSGYSSVEDYQLLEPQTVFLSPGGPSEDDAFLSDFPMYGSTYDEDFPMYSTSDYDSGNNTPVKKPRKNLLQKEKEDLKRMLEEASKGGV